MVRRHDDENDDGALSRRARPAWGLLALIGSILAGAGAVAAAGHTVARAAAQEVVRPVEKKIDDHLAAMVPTRELMMSYVQEEREARRMLLRKIDALCRASPQAQCPLGER
jgi:hypothetical protein